MDGKPSSGTPAQDSGGIKVQQTCQRKSSQSHGKGTEDEEDSDSDEPSSSLPAAAEKLLEPETPVSPTAVLENFRREWEAELKTTTNLNVNSALNLVTTSSASLANPYVQNNPTSMAGAVSISKTDNILNNTTAQGYHPFANVAKNLKMEQSTSAIVSSPNSNPEPNISSSHQGDAGEISASIPNSGTVEEQARRWFLQGIGYERHGDLYDAVRCYRRAVQLVPDIEYRISQGLTRGNKYESNEDTDDDEDSDDSENEFDIDNNLKEDRVIDSEEDPLLVRRFLKQIEQNGWIFFEKIGNPDKVHISDLPVEVISYIMRWVVSKDLDIRSLDMLSTVCKGLYCITRDEKLWEMACGRVWGPSELAPGYLSFREMFLNRPRVRLDGCYISRVTYIRPGEHSFQDQFYRPWHFVQYYRYIRFFPDGNVHFLTSSEEPNAIVPGLREKQPRNIATLKGKYQLYGNNVVTAMVNKLPQVTGSFQRGKRNQEIQEQTSFHVEFEICPVKGRNNWMLRWVHHAAFITKTIVSGAKNNRQTNSTVTSTTFDISPMKYPPLLFSRVKSYTTRSESILE